MTMLIKTRVAVAAGMLFATTAFAQSATEVRIPSPLVAIENEPVPSPATTVCGRRQFLHTPSFLGLTYSADFILLEITFISGRPKEKRLGLLKALNDGVVSAAGISPDDLLITLYETSGENISIGRGLAQRARIPDRDLEAAYPDRSLP